MIFIEIVNSNCECFKTELSMLMIDNIYSDCALILDDNE